ncbi:MAG: hypothetical protein A2X64_06215 [Ignavibacteria bacterium GWF2_33_9]|nr:MAG: hypothetical protein A2X64_06215 [Ignavibacteria bacterium GWF2_33_9]
MVGINENPKNSALKIISDLPDNTTIEDIIYSLYIKNKTNLGLNDLENNNYKSHLQVREDLQKWLI